MNGIAFSAPGKAVLCGDYAVLRGAPAISMAINRRARATLCSAPGACHVVETPGFEAGSWRFETAEDGRVHWLDQPPAGGLRLVEHAFSALPGRALPASALTVDTREFFAAAGGAKLGFGSSAAAVVALVAALEARAGVLENSWLPARRAHSRFMDGHGSGVDVATSYHGGLLAYRRQSTEGPVKLNWPGGLVGRFLYSGRSASTLAKLQQVSDSADQSWSALAAAAEDAVEAWASGDAECALESVRHYGYELMRFSDRHDLGIFAAGHNTLAVLAEEYDAVYKPCGAGGGDIGIVLATNDTAVESFCTRALEYGFTPLNVDLEHSGLIPEEAAPDE